MLLIQIYNMNNLPELTDIIDTFDYDALSDDILNDVCNEEDQLEIIEHILSDLHDYLQDNIEMYSSPKFMEMFDEKCNNIVSDHIELYIDNNHELFDEIFDTIYSNAKILFFNINLPRSHKTNDIIPNFRQFPSQHAKIRHKLCVLDKINETLPEQRTQEWYEMRYNLLSASSIWKALDSECNVNAIIYDKCKPLNTEKYNYVNINTPFHWGQKYEPVSQMYYEYKYNAIIKEYGCITHKDHKFLGASPDGINIKEDSERYGRMLEIKNIVNREITGIPKKEYWIQTQLQMECCDLDECDFLECRFKEYENEEEFNKDGDFNLSSKSEHKGVIIQFLKDDKPHYEYMPFNCSKEDFDKWYDEQLDREDVMWIQNIYWKLTEVSCVLIERNKEWFGKIFHKLEEVWNKIVYERENGYDHRKPKKRINKTVVKKIGETSTLNCGVCLLDNNEKLGESSKKNIKKQTQNVNIIKIDTSSS